MDPSLSNWGLCSGIVQDGRVTFSDLLLVCTEKQGHASKIRQSSDDIFRASLLFRECYQFCVKYKPLALFAEVPMGSQSASAMKSYGVCIGVLTSLRDSLSIPLIEVQPGEIKKKIGAVKNTSKAEIMEWAYKHSPALPWITKKNSDVKLAANEHLADACAAVVTGMETQQWRDIVSIHNTARG